MTDTEVNPVRVRVYTPERKVKGAGKHAILVWFHSGNFCTRTIESPAVDGLARLMADQVFFLMIIISNYLLCHI